MTAVAANDGVNDSLKAACQQVVGDVHGLQRHTQEDVPVERGSPIDDDDGVLTVFSMQELINAPMRAAIDDLLVTAVFLNEWHTVRGYALPTLVRSAITGAGMALWLMDPDVNERRLRALRMSYQIAKNELNFVKGVPVDWNGPNAGPSVATKQQRQASRQQKLQQVLDNGTTLGFTNKQVKNKPDDSMMVEDGAKRLPPGTFSFSPDEHIVSEWRLLSGRAHGLIWPLHYLRDPPTESSDPRFVTVPIAMSLDRMLGSVHNALVMVNCAVDHYTDMVKASP